MIVLDKRDIAGQWVLKEKEAGKSIGFVPTMGALHEGHLSLVRRAKQENDIVVASIFVNPIQFNNKEDLLKYPRTLEADLDLLSREGCHMIFNPATEEMYPDEVKESYDFGMLERLMEGEFRPGHFNGVATVVKRFFDILHPNRAYFGMKDFQQLRIIQSLAKQENLPLEIVPCPIVREADGLAMSSRNRRLSTAERKVAPVIYQSLRKAHDLFHEGKPIEDIISICSGLLNQTDGMRVEYFNIARLDTLIPIKKREDTDAGLGVFVAAWLGQVRLIDNILLNA